MNNKIYRHYPEDFIEDSDHYFKHVPAMTGEKLNSKSDIAAELAFRDERLAEFEKERDGLQEWQKGVYSLSAYLVLHESNSDGTMVKANRLLDIRDLEQQAKGVKWVLACRELNLSKGEVYTMMDKCNQLRNQVKALKEGEL